MIVSKNQILHLMAHYVTITKVMYVHVLRGGLHLVFDSYVLLLFSLSGVKKENVYLQMVHALLKQNSTVGHSGLNGVNVTVHVVVDFKKDDDNAILMSN
jgi:hypothetical protein